MKAIIILSIFLALIVSSYAQDKIKIEAFTESLCPDCIRFLESSVGQAIKDPRFFDMAELIIYPYGNAFERKVGDKWIFSCQHGTVECYGNAIENCAKKYFKGVTFWNWLICVEGDITHTKSWDLSGSSCATKFGIDFAPVKNCATGNENNALVHKAAAKTEGLNPPHTYVPWITVNGQHDVSAENSILLGILTYVCANFKGEKSSACYNL